MKKRLIYGFCMLISSAFIACSSDEDDEPQNNDETQETPTCDESHNTYVCVSASQSKISCKDGSVFSENLVTCPNGCDESTGKCNETKTCTTAVDCPDDQGCAPTGRCMKTLFCSSDEDCTKASRKMCVERFCVQCVADTDCDDGLICSKGSCQSMTCESDADCAANQAAIHCSDFVKICVQCTTNDHCTDEGATCVRYECVSPTT